MKKITAVLLLAVLLISLASCGSVGTKGIENGETKMIAHRGLSAIEVENTDRAFIAAAERSYYGIEADVRRTADGRYVMCHDSDLKKLCGVDMIVEESTLEELLAVELYDLHGKKNPEVGSISTLESYISICKEYDKRAILEFKGDFDKEQIGEIIGIIGELGYLDMTTFISFDYDELLAVREILPDSKVTYLFSQMKDIDLDLLKSDKIDVGINHTWLTRADVEKIHEAGLTVNCWTVDTRFRAMQLVSWGVDYITSNIIE